MAEPITIGRSNDGGRRRLMVLAGVAVAVLLAAVVLPGLLFGGGGGAPIDESFAPTEPNPVATTVPGSQPEGGAEPGETFEAFTSKNPFSPLVDLSPVEASTPAPDVPLPDAGIDPAFDPTVTGGSFPTFPVDDGSIVVDPVSSPPTTAPAPPARTPDRVSLLEVFRDVDGRVVASVRVNDITYQSAAGDEFASAYRVIALDDDARCAQLLYGDERFGLCEGDEALK